MFLFSKKKKKKKEKEKEKEKKKKKKEKRKNTQTLEGEETSKLSTPKIIPNKKNSIPPTHGNGVFCWSGKNFKVISDVVQNPQ